MFQPMDDVHQIALNQAHPQPPNGEAGQAVIVLLFMVSVFMVGVLGLAVDMTNLWYHRQMASAAADAACQAGSLDMLSATGGETLSSAGFTVGANGDCATTSAAVMCAYAKFNGYNGAGLSASAPSNAVAWTFLNSVPGVTPVAGTNSYMKVTVSENVPSYFVRLLNGKPLQTINVSASCGSALVKGAAPIVVLHPTMSGALNYANNAGISILGGQVRSIQVNSTSPTAVTWGSGGFVDLSKGGPYGTGSDMSVSGGPTSPPGSASSFLDGTTGHWKSSTVPIGDPYGSVAVPSSVKNLTPSYGVNGTNAAYGVNGCPDSGAKKGCTEYAPGYYPSGLHISGNATTIFDPGIYYMNGSLKVDGGSTLRVAKPPGHVQTDGVMFYFYSGSMSVTGNSGTPSTTIDNVDARDLTCDGSYPPSSIGLGTSLAGNVLYAQCTTNATYYDSGHDTTDTISNSGSRGLLVFQDHSNSTAPVLIGTGSMTFSGSLYFHSTGYNTVMSFGGGGSAGSYVLGEIVTDQLTLTGNGVLHMYLNPAPTFELAKVGLFQ